ncbi:hypothetical protein NO1_1547 [Candidatus Termititenax aidoneus]|uniref:Uncharacterized protein n=1 Tax=Termititenax aidoneus TaxID=2218524 RepID=A0A388TBZ7_TERA1|nr:hypothetical protein NO1_1547 [Candidatus Termititenax aidoneus]
MKINWQKTFVFLTMLALGLTLAGCGKTASGGGSSGGGGGGGGGGQTQTTLSGDVTTADVQDALNGYDIVNLAVSVDFSANDIEVPANKTLKIAEDVTVTFNYVTLNGTIEVSDGAILVNNDLSNSRGRWQENSSAAIVYKAGSSGYIGAAPFIVPTGEPGLINLERGSLSLKSSDGPDGTIYALNGEAKLNGTFELGGSGHNWADVLDIQSGAELVVADSAKLAVAGNATVTVKGTFINYDSGALENNGNLVVVNGGLFTSKNGLDGNGTVTIEAGAYFYNNGSMIHDAQSLNYVFKPGATYIDNSVNLSNANLPVSIDDIQSLEGNEAYFLKQGATSTGTGKPDPLIVLSPGATLETTKSGGNLVLTFKTVLGEETHFGSQTHNKQRVVAGSGTLVIDGVYGITSGGTLTVDNGATLTIGDGAALNNSGGAVNNNGTVNKLGTGTIAQGNWTGNSPVE